MNSQDIPFLNILSFPENNDILCNIVDDLEKIIQNLDGKDKIDNIINQLKNIIIILNKIIIENKKDKEYIINYFKEMNNNINKSKIYTIIKTEIYDNGDKYIDQFKKGERDGEGTMYYSKNNERERDKYEGSLKNGLFDGKGIIYWNNGDKFGYFKNGFKDGKGIYFWNDKSRYEGEYKEGKMEGKGIINFKDGSRYEGEFKAHKKDGKGIY